MIFTEKPTRIKLGDSITPREIDGFIVLYGAPVKGEVTSYLIIGRKRVTPIMETVTRPLLDEDGNQLYSEPEPVFTQEMQPMVDEDNNPILDEDGNPVMMEVQVPLLDEDGYQVYEGGGEPLYQQVVVQTGEKRTLIGSTNFTASTRKLKESDFDDKNVLLALHDLYVGELIENNPDVDFQIEF
jgi:hypothetical protein